MVEMNLFLKGILQRNLLKDSILYVWCNCSNDVWYPFWGNRPFFQEYTIEMWAKIGINLIFYNTVGVNIKFPYRTVY